MVSTNIIDTRPNPGIADGTHGDVTTPSQKASHSITAPLLEPGTSRRSRAEFRTAQLPDSPPAMSSYREEDRRGDDGGDDDGIPKPGGVVVAFAGEDETRILRKIDRRILPFILLAYLFQQLDKSTLMYASVFGITDDANLVGKQLSWLGSVLYVAQLIAQPIAAATLVKYPLGKVISVAILLWGLTLCMMSTCTTFFSLLCARFVLGAFESIIAPSCLAVTQMWYKKEEQTLRVSSWNAMNGIAPIVGGILSYILGHIESNSMYTYQIIFLACGLLTIGLSVPVWLYLPDTPSQAPFLTHREKLIIAEHQRLSHTGSQSKSWNWNHVWECLTDTKTWCWVVMHTALAIPSGGIGVFGSLIIKDFGFDKFQTILFNIPIGLVQFVVILGSAWLATRTSRKGPVIGMICSLPMLGCVLLLLIPHTPEHRALLLCAYLIITVNSAITPLNLTWQAQNTAGGTKKQCTTALMFVGSCFGNVIGPLLYDPGQAPLYATGLGSSLLMFSTVLGTSVFTYAYLTRLNRIRGNTRGQYFPLSNPLSARDQADDDEEARNPQAGTPVDANLDLTDLEAKDFEYVL